MTITRRARRMVARRGIGVLVFLAAIIPAGARAQPGRHTAAAPAYRLTHWTLADGAPAGIRAIAQTGDGFLWLGAVNGLYRFDGVTFERIQPKARNSARSTQVNALLATPDGSLLAGYQHGGIGIVRHGRLEDVRLPARVHGYVAQLSAGADGSAWALLQGRDMAWLIQFRRGKRRWFHSAMNLPDQPGQSVLQARNGDTYLAMYPSVLRLRAGGARFEELEIKVGLGAKLLEDAGGRIWVIDEKTIRSLERPASPETLPPLFFDNQPRPSTILRSGELWIGGDEDTALRYKTGPAPSALAPVPIRSLASAASGRGRTLSMFEDREGNIWIGRPTGLDRLTRGGPAILSPDLDLTTGFVRAGRAGAIYIGARDGLYRLNRDGAAPSRILLAGRQIYMLCGAKDGRLLVADADRTFLVTIDGTPHLIKQNNDFTPQSCTVDAGGRFWVQKHGLFSVEGGRFVPAPASYGAKQRGRVLRAIGRSLISYSPTAYLVKFQDERTTTLWTGDKIAVGAVQMIAPFDAGFIVAGENGLAYNDGARFPVLDAQQYPFLSGLTGLMPDRDGRTWLLGSEGIFRVSTNDLRNAFEQPGRRISASHFGREQGLASRLSAYDADDVIQGADGKIWLNTNQGLAWIDPNAQAGAAIAPNVVIRSLEAAGRRFPGSAASVRLPVGTTDVRFDFTALGLTDANANRFQYRLEGRDESWTDAGTRREAFYTNLGPGEYVFRVKAANSAGLWSKADAVLPFAIRPAFYQTAWFSALLAGLALVALWLLYRVRLAALGERLRQRIEGQVEERERIARELHDTFLQSVQGLILRFQAIAEMTPVGSKSRREMDEALDRSDEVLAEGRERVFDLRDLGAVVDLEERLMPLLEGTETLDTIGARQPVCAPIVNQTVAVVREALLNARRHAAATTIEVTTTYRRRNLTITICDDGIGIDRVIAMKGREGHFGLRGMRERADTMNAALTIEPVAAGGTMVRLVIPVQTAFKDRPKWSRLFG